MRPRRLCRIPRLSARAVAAATALLVGSIAACEGGPPAEEAPQGPTAEDSVQMAAQQFDASVFDTIAWDSAGAAHARGGIVFTYSCAKCHGPRGFGDGGFIAEGDTLRPPSFHRAAFPFEEDLGGLRRQIYTGRPGGMPHWGLTGLGYRDVDAVGRYILEVLR